MEEQLIGEENGLANARPEPARASWSIMSVLRMLVTGIFPFIVGTAEACVARDKEHFVGEVVGTLTAIAGGCYIAMALYCWYRSRSRYARLPEDDVGRHRGMPPFPAGARKALTATVLVLEICATALLLVHVSSTAPAPGAAFPDGCPLGPQDPGCYRVAPISPSEGAPAGVFLRLARQDAQHLTLQWLDAQPRTQLLESDASGSAVHAQAVSRMWGFIDDLYVRLSCNGTDTLVEAQGQLRLGHGDMGVNRERVDRLLSYLQRGPANAGNELQEAACDSQDGETWQ